MFQLNDRSRYNCLFTFFDCFFLQLSQTTKTISKIVYNGNFACLYSTDTVIFAKSHKYSVLICLVQAYPGFTGNLAIANPN